MHPACAQVKLCAGNLLGKFLTFNRKQLPRGCSLPIIFTSSIPPMRLLGRSWVELELLRRSEADGELDL